MANLSRADSSQRRRERRIPSFVTKGATTTDVVDKAVPVTHISALSVCVNYAPLLRRSLALWRNTTENLLIVTAERDQATIELCRSLGVQTYLTDAFWENGAKFNKGLAMSRAYEELKPSDWMLFFDADIVPPANWRRHLRGLRPGSLYGTYRCDERGKKFGDPDIAGFFHFAHISDPNMQIRPIVDTHWAHAGNYDTTFQNRWAQEQRVRLNMTVMHLGDEPGANWFGVGNKNLVDAMHKERRRRRGQWDHETVEWCVEQNKGQT